MANVSLIAFIILLLAFVGVPVYLFFKKKKLFYEYKKKLGTIGQVIFGLLILGLLASPLAPYNNGGWFWERFTGATDTPVIPLGGDHLDHNGETDWSGIDVTFTIKPAYDRDGGMAASDTDSITFRIFSGTISPYDQAVSSDTNFHLGQSPSGSVNCFSFWE